MAERTIRRKPGNGKKHHRGRRKIKGKARGGIVSNIALAVAVVVFCVSAYQLAKIGKGYLDGRNEYKKITELTVQNKADKESGSTGFQVDFDALKEMNPDTIGWIRFSPEPSIINYPVVQGENNQEYLHKTFTANENTMGSIFLNVDNKPDFSEKNSIVYGHRMKDGSMFRHLQDYESQDFWKANPYFYIYTLDGREITYHVYSAGEVVDTSDTYLTDFASNEDYQKFLDMTKEVSLYDTGVEVTTYDTIVTLSTCTSSSDEHRFVVRGVKVNEADTEG